MLKTFPLLRPAALALALVVAAAGAAEALTWRMATKQPPDSPEGKSFQFFADMVETFSDGEMTVETFPSEQLGKADAVLEQLQAGTIHIYAEGPAFLEKWVPAMSYIASEFLFDDRDHWRRFMESDLVAGWLDAVEEEAGIVVIGGGGGIVDFMRGPYRVTTATRPFNDLDEFQGIKLRMHENDLAVAQWAHLGAEVRVLGWTDVYESLGRDIVEAVNSEIASVEPMKFYEQAKYVMRHDSKEQGIGLMTNAEAYHGLSPELRDVVDNAQKAAGAFSVEYTALYTRQALDRMREDGVTFIQVNNEPFIERMASFYDSMAQDGQLPDGFLETVAVTRQ